jgi:hypothetical protein
VTADDLPPGSFSLDNSRWDAWRPQEVAERLTGLDVPWCVAAGWALDLFRGEQTRDHADLEIAVPAAGFGALRAALAEFDFHVVGSGRAWTLESPAFSVTHQTWVTEPASGVYRLDVFREPHDGSTWICRRDETIRLPYPEIIRRTPDGVPFLAPEFVLLFHPNHPWLDRLSTTG